MPGTMSRFIVRSFLWSVRLRSCKANPSSLFSQGTRAPAGVNPFGPLAAGAAAARGPPLEGLHGLAAQQRHAEHTLDRREELGEEGVHFADLFRIDVNP